MGKLSEFITANYDDLSGKSQRHVDNTRPHLVPDSYIKENWDALTERAQAWVQENKPDLLNKWSLYEGGVEVSGGREVSGSSDDALAEAEMGVDSSNYPSINKTRCVEVEVRNLVTGERLSSYVECHPPEPECQDSKEHEWKSPHDVVGGLESNPGVRSSSDGGVAGKECCAGCGVYKMTDSRVEFMGTDHTFEEIAYAKRDDESMAFVLRTKLEKWLGTVNGVDQELAAQAAQRVLGVKTHDGLDNVNPNTDCKIPDNPDHADEMIDEINEHFKQLRDPTSDESMVFVLGQKVGEWWDTEVMGDELIADVLKIANQAAEDVLGVSIARSFNAINHTSGCVIPTAEHTTDQIVDEIRVRFKHLIDLKISEAQGDDNSPGM